MKNKFANLFILLAISLNPQCQFLSGMDLDNVTNKTPRFSMRCELNGSPTAINNLIFTNTNGFVLTNSTDGSLNAWNTTTGSLIRTILKSQPLIKFGLNPAHSRFIGILSNTTFSILDIPTNEITTITSPSADLKIIDFIWSPHGDIFALLYEKIEPQKSHESAIQICAFENRKIIALETFQNAKTISFDSQNTFALTFQKDHYVDVFQWKNLNKPVRLLKRYWFQNRVDIALISHILPQVIVFSKNYSIFQIKSYPDRKKQSAIFKHTAYMPTGLHNFEILNSTETFFALSTSQYSQDIPQTSVIKIFKLNPPKSHLFLCDIFQQGTNLIYVKWSPNGQYLATSTSNNIVTIWKFNITLSSPFDIAPIYKIQGTFLAWGNDSKLFATTNYLNTLNTVHIWEID